MPRAGDGVLKEKKSQGLAERVAKKKKRNKKTQLSTAQPNSAQTQHDHE